MKHTFWFNFLAFENPVEYIMPIFDNVTRVTHKCLSGFEYLDVAFFAFFETFGWEDSRGIQVSSKERHCILTFAFFKLLWITISIKLSV